MYLSTGQKIPGETPVYGMVRELLHASSAVLPGQPVFVFPLPGNVAAAGALEWLTRQQSVFSELAMSHA